VVLLIMVPSVLMGMLFPLGLKITANINQDFLPYMIGINGISSVFGSTISIIAPLFFGFKITFIFGVFFYILAISIIKIIR